MSDVETIKFLAVLLIAFLVLSLLTFEGEDDDN